MKGSRSTYIKILITLLSIVFIVLYFMGNPIDFERLFNGENQINWNYFWIGTILAFVSNFLDGLAWHRILVFLDKRITAMDAVINHFLGFSLGIFIPAAGTAELASKSIMLSKKYPGFTSEETISSIAAIRTVFLVTAYVSWGFLIVSLGMENIISPEITVIALIGVWIALTIVIYILIAFFGNVDRFSAALNYLSRSSSSHKRAHGVFDIIKKWLENFSKSFQAIIKMPRKEIITMMVLVFLQNFIKWISVYYIYKAVLDLPFYAVMFISVAIGFVNLVPALIPGLAGLREIATAEGLSVFGLTEDLRWLSSLLQSISLYLFFLLAFAVGLVYWLRLKPVKEERFLEQKAEIYDKMIEKTDPVP
jgi:uncharacterized membrane protein YbhN (UPF0104 family)